MVAVRDAVADGAEGDTALAAVLESLPKDRQVVVAAALGDVRGVEGPGALRRALERPDASRDLRCAALIALAKRCGVAASADLFSALDDRDGAVKEYAI